MTNRHKLRYDKTVVLSYINNRLAKGYGVCNKDLSNMFDIATTTSRHYISALRVAYSDLLTIGVNVGDIVLIDGYYYLK